MIQNQSRRKGEKKYIKREWNCMQQIYADQGIPSLLHQWPGMWCEQHNNNFIYMVNIYHLYSKAQTIKCSIKQLKSTETKFRVQKAFDPQKWQMLCLSDWRPKLWVRASTTQFSNVQLNPCAKGLFGMIAIFLVRQRKKKKKLF